MIEKMGYRDAFVDISLTIMALLLRLYYGYPQIAEVPEYQITGRRAYQYPYRLFSPNPGRADQRRVSNMLPW